jgi:hypothetical protein
MPAVRLAMWRMNEYIAAYDRTIAAVPSVDPSSTMIHTTGLSVWLTTEVKVSSIEQASSFTGDTTA